MYLVTMSILLSIVMANLLISLAVGDIAEMQFNATVATRSIEVGQKWIVSYWHYPRGFHSIFTDLALSSIPMHQCRTWPGHGNTNSKL